MSSAAITGTDSLTVTSLEKDAPPLSTADQVVEPQRADAEKATTDSKGAEAQDSELGKQEVQDCDACAEYMGCSKHVEQLRMEIKKYYKGPLDYLGLKQEVDRARLNKRRNGKQFSFPTAVTSSLAKCLSYFYRNYYDKKVKGEETLKYGNINVSFATSELPNLCKEFGDDVFIIPKREYGYFTMGAIFFYPMSREEETFCCIFEDGSFFCCCCCDGRVVHCKCGNGQIYKLLMLKQIIADHSLHSAPREDLSVGGQLISAPAPKETASAEDDEEKEDTLPSGNPKTRKLSESPPTSDKTAACVVDIQQGSTSSQACEDLSLGKPGKARDCFTCIRLKKVCIDHAINIEKQIRKYYRGPLTYVGIKRYAAYDIGRLDWKKYHVPQHSVTYTLSKYLYDFACGYCDAYLEKEQNLTLEYGNIGVQFTINNSLPDLHKHFGETLLEIPRRKYDENTFQYFTQGAIFFYAHTHYSREDEEDATFCCVFEDGGYFYCDPYKTDRYTYARKLMTLKKILTEREKEMSAGEECQPTSPPTDEEYQEMYSQAMY